MQNKEQHTHPGAGRRAPLLAVLGILVLLAQVARAEDRVCRFRHCATAALSISTDDGALGSVVSTEARYYGDPRRLEDPDDPNGWGEQLRVESIPTTYLAISAQYRIQMTHYLDTRQIDEPPDHAPASPAPFSAPPNPPFEHNYGFWPGESQGPGNAGTWDDWANVASLGHEIGSHSVNHPTGGIDSEHADAPLWSGAGYDPPFHGWLPAFPSWWQEYLEAREDGVNRSFRAPTDELAVSKWRIEQQLRARAARYPALKDYTVLSFAYPMGDSAAYRETGAHYVSARLAAGGPVDGAVGPPDWRRMPAVAWEADNLPKMISEVDAAIASGSWLHQWGHGLGRIFCCYLNPDTFVAFVAYAAARRDAGELWIDTVGNVSRYLRERLDATLAVDRGDLSGGGVIAVTLRLRTLPGHPLAAVYTVPLTVELGVPSTWRMAAVRRGELVEQVPIERAVARFDVIPDGSLVELSEGPGIAW
ncbi:MAG: hypothetical protein HYV63_22300 [Candidatus Schekmanbacteria bacterium]|nr:hypothetical protein [Candidatus Schekmanbacteria bacterium]